MKKQFNINDIRHENIRSNMLIAIIRYANNKCHFIIFDLSCAIIPSLFAGENKFNSASPYSLIYLLLFDWKQQWNGSRMSDMLP